MGGVESRFDNTNWDEADGGLSGEAKCMAGQTATHGKKKITLKKKEMLNHRIYDVADAEDTLIFKFKPTPESFQWFELTGPTEKKSHPNKGLCQNLCRAAKVSENKTLVENVGNYVVGSWTLYSYVRPAFEGQEGDKKGRMENELIADEQIPIYRAYEVSFDHVTKTHAVIKPFVEDPEGKEKRGVPGETMYKLEKVKSTTKQIFQLSVPDADGVVAFWQWNNTLTHHQMELEVAKGVDLALVGTLAVLANVVKETEQFPFSIKSAFTQ